LQHEDTISIVGGVSRSGLVEFNKHAYASLCENFDAKKVFFGDVRDFNLDELDNIDLVADGPPCQPFSLGGKHQADQDKRDMFPSAIQAIERLQPKAFIFENVKGLLRATFAEYFEYILLRLTYPSFDAEVNSNWKQHLDELRGVSQLSFTGTKYNVQFKLINAADYGVPQNRDRVIIIGIRSDLECEWSFPSATHSADRLFWDMYITGEYWERHQICKSERPSILQGRGYCKSKRDRTANDKSLATKISKLTEKYGRCEPILTPLAKAMLHYPVIARKHNMYAIVSDSVGLCDNFISVGQSAVWNNQGELLMKMDSESEGLLIVDTISGKASIHELQNI
jgi:DNA (cytosine-5)-methyltransferase 1